MSFSKFQYKGIFIYEIIVKGRLCIICERRTVAEHFLKKLIKTNTKG